MIAPTVGRVVWYRPSDDELQHIPAPPQAGEPLAAHVAQVNEDSTVNLMVIDGAGSTFGRTNVPLVQDGAPWPNTGFCEWMPYQKGQAAKAEALESKLTEQQLDGEKAKIEQQKEDPS